MRGKKEHVILSNDDQEQLIALSRRQNASYKLVMRAKLILMSASGKDHKAIAEKLDIQPRIVTKWVRRWNETATIETMVIEDRLGDLERPGAPNKFTSEQKCKIISVACERPEVYHRPITHWTNKELTDEVIKQGIVSKISSRHIGYILKKNNVRPHKIRYWLNGKPDEKKMKK
jgi:putative transposase